MHVRSLAFGFAIVGTSSTCGTSYARAAETATEIGLFTALLTGTHVSSDVAPASGIVPGAALEVTQHVDRFRLHLEGIPTAAAAAAGRGAFGSTSASLALLDATAFVDLDARRRVRVGAGVQIVDLTNHDGRDGVRNAVRVTSPLYAAAATLPLPRGRFVELALTAAPNVRGVLHAVDRIGAKLPATPECGAEIDYAAAYGFGRGGVTYALGLRGLNYHTRDPSTGRLVDRNTGAGATFEARFALGRRPNRR